MNKTKSTFMLAGFAAIVFIFGAFVLSYFTVIKGDGGRWSRWEAESPSKMQVAEPELGAFPGPNITEQTLTFNGFTKHYYSQRMASNSTSTVCRILLPSATTTVAHVGAAANNMIDFAGTPVFSIFAADEGGDATSTITALAGTRNFELGSGGGRTGVVAATSTIGTTTLPSISGTNRYLIFDFIGSSTPTLNGYCTAELNQVSQ